MFRIVLLTVLIASGNAKWLQTEATVNVETTGEKPFSLSVCGEDSEETYINPIPDCRAPKNKVKSTPMYMTMFKPIITNQPIKAIVCKKLEVTTQTFKNFINSKFKLYFWLYCCFRNRSFPELSMWFINRQENTQISQFS